jgi:hypothetical protein
MFALPLWTSKIINDLLRSFFLLCLVEPHGIEKKERKKMSKFNQIKQRGREHLPDDRPIDKKSSSIKKDTVLVSQIYTHQCY